MYLTQALSLNLQSIVSAALRSHYPGGIRVRGVGLLDLAIFIRNVTNAQLLTQILTQPRTRKALSD